MRLGVWVLVATVAPHAVAGTRVLQPAGIQRVAWLQGCWETRSPQRTIEEQWMAPRGGSMIGSDSSVIFENLQHDFPQRIGYQRNGPDSLLAWIEGTEKGQVRRVEFPYRRTRCPGE